MSYSRVCLYDGMGRFMTEVETAVKRSWVLNDYGKCEFSLGVNDEKCRGDYLRYGNFVVVEHERLPVWGGMVDPPRKWDGVSVAVTAYGGCYGWVYRRMAAPRVLSGSAGSIFRQLVEASNAESPTLVRVGDVFAGGESFEREFDTSAIYDHVMELVADSGEDFDVAPVVDGGRLWFGAHWRKQLGVFCGLALEEGHNLEEGSGLTERGRIYNDVVGYGSGSTWESKETARVFDDVSRTRYGVRQVSRSMNTNVPGTVRAQAVGFLAGVKGAEVVPDLGVLDVGGAWGDLRVGNVVGLRLLNMGFNGGGVGFDGKVRILGMRYEDGDGAVSVKCEVYDG